MHRAEGMARQRKIGHNLAAGVGTKRGLVALHCHAHEGATDHDN